MKEQVVTIKQRVDAYREGRQSFKDGKRIWDCPYSDAKRSDMYASPSLINAWRGGFRDERAGRPFWLVWDESQEDTSMTLISSDELNCMIAELHHLREVNADLLAACEFALNKWFDDVYPPDIFVGGPSSDPGVNLVRKVREKLRDAILKDAEEQHGNT